MAHDRSSVRLLRDAATQAWSEVLGDSTACVLAKSGQSHPAGKFHEGRVAALGELLRLLTDDATPDQVRSLAEDLRETWLHRPQPGAGANREWESYRAGGVSALGELGTKEQLWPN